MFCFLWSSTTTLGKLDPLQQLCAWLKKRAQGREKKCPVLWKRLISPFFNPSYSAFICMEIPPLIMHWCSLNCEPCLLHSFRHWFWGGLVTLDFQGKPTWFLFWWCKHAVFSFLFCSTSIEKMERIANGMSLGGKVSFWCPTDPGTVSESTLGSLCSYFSKQ